MLEKEKARPDVLINCFSILFLYKQNDSLIWTWNDDR